MQYRLDVRRPGDIVWQFACVAQSAQDAMIALVFTRTNYPTLTVRCRPMQARQDVMASDNDKVHL